MPSLTRRWSRALEVCAQAPRLLLLAVAVSALGVGVAVGAGGAPDHGMHMPPPASTTAPADQTFAGLMASAMTTMDHGMRHAPMTGDPDHDFAAMMIPHHQGAIDMAKAELLYGTNPVLRRLAQEIVVTQGSEITVMHRELQTPTPPSTPSGLAPH